MSHNKQWWWWMQTVNNTIGMKNAIGLIQQISLS
jgi:hypothetical protein